MEDIFSRTGMMLGEEAMAKLRQSRVAVFGIGGVGGSAAEALCRCGVGSLDLFDGDVVNVTNINRQIVALQSTIGRPKVEVMRERMADINPDARVRAHYMYYLPENAGGVDLSQYDYILDAVDMVAAKVELAVRAQAAGIPIIAAMGAGNKLDPARFVVADIVKTRVCPLARVMRRELKERGIQSLKVVYSPEKPRQTCADSGECPMPQDSGPRRYVPGSISFVTATAGLILAGEIVRDLTGLRAGE